MALNQDVAFRISADVSGQQAVDRLSDSLKRMGAQGETSAKQMAWAMRMVPAQLTDITTGLLTGQNAMTVFIQQGGQLRDMFGGFGAAATGVGRVLLGLLTPMNALLAVVGATAYAAFKGQSDFNELANKLTLTGNAAGYSAGQIEKMARTLSDTAGISQGKARDLASALATSGQFVGKNLELAEQTAARVQKLTGQTAEEVAKDFAGMSKSVAAWAAEHNRSFNYLTVAEFQHIKNLEDMGNKEAAMQANMDALNREFKSRTQELGFLERGWNAVKDAASGAWQAMLNIGKPETNEDKLAGLKQQLQTMDMLAGKRLNGPMRNTPETAEFKKQYEDARANLVEQMKLLQQATDRGDAERLAKAQAAAATRQKIEEIQSGRLAALQNANVALELEKLKGAAEDRIAALEQEGQRVENLYRTGVYTEEQYNAAKLSIAKKTLQERIKLAEAEMAAEKKRPASTPADQTQREARLQALRNQVSKFNADGTMAEIKAEGDHAESIRKSNDELEKFARTQNTRAEQIKLQAQSLGMGTLEYRKHTEALRIDKEAADAAKGKSPEFVQRILAEAEAQKKATNAALDYAHSLEIKDAVTKFRRGQQDEIEQINNEAQQVNMLSLQYAKHTAALRIDKAARDASIGQSPEMVAAILAEAEAQKIATNAALDHAHVLKTDFGTGVRTAFKEYYESAQNAANQGKTLFTNAFQGMEDALVDFVKTGKLEFSKLADSIIADMARMVIKKQIMAPLMNSFASMFSFADGGVMTPSGAMPLKTYASGGIANSPQMALFGEGRTPEAFVPLPDGRNIPVKMQGGGGGSNVTVNVVNNAGNAQATTQERQDSGGNRIIDVVIEQVKASIAADISRGRGTVTNALERTYGANRTAGAY